MHVVPPKRYNTITVNHIIFRLLLNILSVRYFMHGVILDANLRQLYSKSRL